MTDTREMLDASPNGVPVDAADLAAAIDACLSCVQSCTTCADADLAEPDVAEMSDCIAMCVMCADVCWTTARALSRPAHWDRLVVVPLLEACIRTCTGSAEECARHHHHRHCAICEGICRACVAACTVLLQADALQGAAG